MFLTFLSAKTSYFDIIFYIWLLILFLLFALCVIMTVCVETIVKTKLNVLCFITHFQQQHNTKNLFSCFHTCSHTTSENSQFLHGAHKHKRTGSTTTRTKALFSLLLNMWVRPFQLSICYLFTYGKCAPAEIFNASDYQKQIFSRAFYSSMMV